MLRNFSFVLAGELAGSAFPGWSGDLEEDLQEADEAGITAIVSLTEQPPDLQAIEAVGFRHLHLPVSDFSPPTLSQVREFVAFVDEEREAGGAVLVHCRAGVGRTGTMLAAYLVHEGKSAADAVRAVRRSRPGSIETGAQEKLLQQFAKVMQAP